MSTLTNKERFWDGIVKIFKEQETDVLLKAFDCHDGAAIPAHKLILSARSEVFKKMFESDEHKASSVLETITLVDLTRNQLKALVDFIYSDGSMLSYTAKVNVVSLYRAADKYEIPHLRDLCRYELIATLKPSNALKVLPLAEIPYDKTLSDASLRVITTNVKAICLCKELEGFVVEHPNLTVQIFKAISMVLK